MQSSNNVITLYSEVNTSADQIRSGKILKATFRINDYDQSNRRNGLATDHLGSTHCLYVNGYNNDFIGDKSWLVSPVLDFQARQKPA